MPLRTPWALLLGIVPALPLFLGSGCSVPSPTHPTVSSLRKALTFHASFDRTTDADFAKGDPWLYHAPGLDKVREARPGLPAPGQVAVEPGAGRYGGGLRFVKRGEEVVFFRAGGNLPYLTNEWSGTVSFWLKTDAATLAPGYADPVNITPRAWDDAAFWVDFEKRTNDIPFRLGAMADRKVWNPLNRNFDELPIAERPCATIPGPPFRAERWTHVAFTWEHFNTGRSNGVAILYLDGAQVGSIRGRNQWFTWNPSEARIHLGVGYVGAMDDLAVFNRAFSMPELQAIRALPSGVRTLYAP